MQRQQNLPRLLPLRTSLRIIISFDCAEDSIERTGDRGLLSDTLKDIRHAVPLPDVRGSLEIPMSSSALNINPTSEGCLEQGDFPIP